MGLARGPPPSRHPRGEPRVRHETPRGRRRPRRPARTPGEADRSRSLAEGPAERARDPGRGARRQSAAGTTLDAVARPAKEETRDLRFRDADESARLRLAEAGFQVLETDIFNDFLKDRLAEKKDDWAELADKTRPANRNSLSFRDSEGQVF